MSSTNTTTQPDRVDVRGPRFAAWVTTAVLVVALIVSAISPLAAAIVLGLQALVFAIGAVAGPRRHPYGQLFAKVVAPRLGPVKEREPVPPLEVRPTGRTDLRGRRRRADSPPVGPRGCGGRHRHRFRAGGGLPECGLRHLPGLPALPARRALPAHRIRSRANEHRSPQSNRKDPHHGTLRRPGLRRLGREQSRRRRTSYSSR